MSYNNTPAYQGSGQAVAASSGGGILGTLAALLGGGGTPAYVGDGQPSSGASGGLLGGGAPAYKPAPASTPVAQAPTENVSVEGVTCDADPFGSQTIAIVIPRQG